MPGFSEYEHLTTYLSGEGYSPEEIEKVINRLRQHDDSTFRDSAFDSIANGTFDLRAIIEQTLGQK